MANSIWDLFVKLSIDTGQFSKGMDGAAAKSKNATGSMVAQFGKLAAGAVAAAGGISLLTNFVMDSVAEASNAQKSQTQLNAVLTSTKGAAGISATAINEMATQMGRLNAIDNDAIVSASNVMLTFTSIGKDVFPGATQAAIDLSAAMGQDLQSSVVQVGKALNDPVAGITALSRVGVSFTDGQKKQIENLVKQNKLFEAQTIILDELNKEFGGSSVAAANTYEGSIKRLNLSINNLKETIGKGLLPGLTGTATQLAINSDMLQDGISLWKVLEYNQRLYSLSEKDAIKLMEYYYTSQEKVTESGFMQAAMMDGRLTPAIEEQTEALVYQGATGWAALPSFMQDYITKSDEVYAANMQSAQAVATIDQNFQNMQVSAQKALDAIDEAKTAQKNFQTSFAESVVKELEQRGVQGKALEDAKKAIDSKYGTEYEWQGKVLQSAKDIAEKYANTGDLSAFTEAMDTKIKELEKSNAKLLEGKELIDKQVAGMAYLTGQTWMINVMYQIQGGIPSAPSGADGKVDKTGDQSDFASGVSNFIVPAGYPNDSYKVGLTSGERVNVTPAGRTNTTNMGGPVSSNVTNNYSFNYSGNATGQQVYQSYEMARITG